MEKIKIQNIDDVVWVTNEWVYYMIENENNDSLWRIPIKKTENGDKLKVSGKEKLISMEYIDFDVYITDSYIIFSGCEKENKSSSLYKYEIQDKKNTKLRHLDLDYSEIMYGEEFPLMIDGMLFVCDDHKIYQLNPDTDDVKKIYQSSDESNVLDMYDGSICSVSNGCLYFTDCGNNFYKYNVGDEKAECLISSDNFEKVMENFNLWGEKSKGIYISIDDYYIYNGQVYFIVYAYWKEKDSKNFGKSVWVEYDGGEVLLNAPLDDITNLHCVDTVEKYIDNHTKWEYFLSGSRYCAGKERYMDFIDGKILLYTAMDSEGSGETAVVYNLDTGKIKEISIKKYDKLCDDYT